MTIPSKPVASQMIQSKPASATGGVKGFPIEGPMRNERYRVQGMTPEERAWRMQWLKDQILSPNEPKPIPGYYEQRLNPIRRFYRWPLETIFRPLIPTLGFPLACQIRWWTGKIGLSIAIFYMGYYALKYNQGDWTKVSGFHLRHNRPRILPGEPEYPYCTVRENNEYATEGFDKSPI